MERTEDVWRTLKIRYAYCNIYFYDLETKTLKKEYVGIGGRISLIDSHFYVITHEKFFIFNQEGELTDEICFRSKIGNFIKTSYDGFMFPTNGYLFISSHTKAKVLKFKL